MSWLYVAIYYAIGVGVGVYTFWPYRGHSLMSGVGLPAIVGLVAWIWPLWLIHRTWTWIVETLSKRGDR